jgi:uncharacterized protein YciI
MAPPDAGPDAVGLCWTCRHKRAVTTRRGATFFRCARAEADPRFVRYPPLPMRSCGGYEDAMLYVVLVHYTQPLAAVDALRHEHVEFLERYAREGVVHAWARRDPPSGGVIVLVAPDRASVETLIAQDPYVRGGVAQAEIVAFSPANVRGPVSR